MLDTIINGSLAIVQQVEALIRTTRQLIASGRLDEGETNDLYDEIERITDVMLAIDEATRRLRQMFDIRPEMARSFSVHATLQ